MPARTCSAHRASGPVVSRRTGAEIVQPPSGSGSCGGIVAIGADGAGAAGDPGQMSSAWPVAAETVPSTRNRLRRW